MLDLPVRFNRGYDHVWLLVANALTVLVLSGLVVNGSWFLLVPLTFLLFTNWQSRQSALFQSGFRRIRCWFRPSVRITVVTDTLSVIVERKWQEPFFEALDNKLFSLWPDARHVESGTVNVDNFNGTLWFSTIAEAVAFRLHYSDDVNVEFPD